jgi:hypothetical protein
MTNIEILQLVLGSGGFLGIAFVIFRTGRIVEKIGNLDKDLNSLKTDIKDLKIDIVDIKERVSFIESFVFFSEFQAESNNPRSAGAKKMWERRKMKKVSSKT